MSDDYSGPLPTQLVPVMRRLRDALVAIVPGLDEQHAAQRVTLALSAVYFPAFFGGLYRSLGTLDSEAARRAYVDEVARQALAQR